MWALWSMLIVWSAVVCIGTFGDLECHSGIGATLEVIKNANHTCRSETGYCVWIHSIDKIEGAEVVNISSTLYHLGCAKNATCPLFKDKNDNCTTMSRLDAIRLFMGKPPSPIKQPPVPEVPGFPGVPGVTGVPGVSFTLPKSRVCCCKDTNFCNDIEYEGEGVSSASSVTYPTIKLMVLMLTTLVPTAANKLSSHSDAILP